MIDIRIRLRGISIEFKANLSHILGDIHVPSLQQLEQLLDS